MIICEICGLQMHWKEPEIDLFDSIEIYTYNQDNLIDLYSLGLI